MLPTSDFSKTRAFGAAQERPNRIKCTPRDSRTNYCLKLDICLSCLCHIPGNSSRTFRRALIHYMNSSLMDIDSRQSLLSLRSTFVLPNCVSMITVFMGPIGYERLLDGFHSRSIIVLPSSLVWDNSFLILLHIYGYITAARFVDVYVLYEIYRVHGVIQKTPSGSRLFIIK